MKKLYNPKTQFIEQMKKLLKNQEDLNNFFKLANTEPKKSIRINTLKINPEKLKNKLQKKNWNLQSLNNHPEILQIQNQLSPGELGNSIEHILGYYYVQEITSMMPIIALQPSVDDCFLDLCAAPGSKTTQAASVMNNKGTIIANDVSIGRIKVLSANLERFGITNTIITRHEGIELCNKLKKLGFEFDKILIDAPCSGEGNIRVSPRTFLEWSEGLLKKLSKKQKQLINAAFQILKPDREMIYSTCTHSPEENELVIQYLLDNNKNAKIIPITNLPIKTRPGITSWNNKKLHPDLRNSIRIYHHDNNMEGFFLCKIKKQK